MPQPFGLSVTVDKKVLHRMQNFIKVFPDKIEKSVKRATDYAHKEILKNTPVKTGALRSSFIKESIGRFSYNVTSKIGRGKDYAIFVEKGTGLYKETPSYIFPKRAKFLVFPIIKGNTITKWIKTKFTRGMPGKFMVHRAVLPTIKKLNDLIKTEIYKMWGK